MSRRRPRQGNRLSDLPRAFATYLIVVQIGVVLGVLGVAVHGGLQFPEPLTLLLMVVFAIAYEEASRRLARLQIRLSAPLRSDMTSVWAVAAAVALTPEEAVVLMVCICGYTWIRQQRPAGESLVRKAFVAATIVGGTVAAGLTASAIATTPGREVLGPREALAVIVAILVYTVFNRGLVTVGLLLNGVPARDLVGTRHDNTTELATLCMGGLVALALVNAPWLAILVLAPMMSLQRGALVSELETAAITDSKTGLLNAVAWEQLAQRELERALRARRSLAVIIVDIDLFKKVNDQYGHLKGDIVLAGIGQRIRSALRDYDGMGRFGGEEFVAVLPDSDERESLVVAERVRLRVNEMCVRDLVPGFNEVNGQGAERLSVSVGVAVLKSDTNALNELLHAADQALYRAKRNGRNQVQLARRGVDLPDADTVTG